VAIIGVNLLHDAAHMILTVNSDRCSLPQSLIAHTPGDQGIRATDIESDHAEFWAGRRPLPVPSPDGGDYFAAGHPLAT